MKLNAISGKKKLTVWLKFETLGIQVWK